MFWTWAMAMAHYLALGTDWYLHPAVEAPRLRWFVRINDAELVGIMLLVAVATAMARNLRPF